MKRVSAAALAFALCGGLTSPGAQARDKEYSVWLVPSGHEHDDLKSLIATLSREHGTPDFEPHVTLVGLGVVDKATDASVARQVEALAKTICPYTIHLQDVGTTDDPFRSLFLKVEQTPQVMAAGRRGLVFYRKVQQKAPSSPDYFPHLSLLYGNLLPADKERIISVDLKGRKLSDISFTVSKLQLWVTSAKIPDWPKSWDKNWRLVREFPLARDGAGAARP
jgi:2'-5' RNA ligase